MGATAGFEKPKQTKRSTRPQTKTQDAQRHQACHSQKAGTPFDLETYFSAPQARTSLILSGSHLGGRSLQQSRCPTCWSTGLEQEVKSFQVSILSCTIQSWSPIFSPSVFVSSSFQQQLRNSQVAFLSCSRGGSAASVPTCRGLRTRKATR